jgi:hypothetical protein
MKSFPVFAATRKYAIAGSECCSKQHQMPRGHLRVLPSLTRPNLFSGD